MPNPYLYATIALIVVLLVIGAYLGVMVSSEMAKATALQNQLNALKTNYTTLKTQYTQLQSQYNQLEENYTTLEGEYNTLRTNYNNFVNNVTFYGSMLMPVAYVYNGQNISLFAIALNITNPTNEELSITISVSSGTNNLLSPTQFTIPPQTTIVVPLLFIYYNSTFTYYQPITGYGWRGSGGASVGGLKNTSLLVTVSLNPWYNMGPVGIMYNVTIEKVVETNQPVIGLAWYWPSTSLSTFNVFIANPLPEGITINGYQVYSNTGLLLTSCEISPFTADGMGSTWLSLPTYIPRSSYYTPPTMSFYYISIEGWGWGWSTSPSASCTTNYLFPTNTNQLPFGRVVLNTNIGNIVLPLLPLPISPST